MVKMGAMNEADWAGFNLVLVQKRNDLFQIVMPDAFGVLENPAVRFSNTSGFAVRWPVNPHFTGASGIAAILSGGADKTSGARFFPEGTEFSCA